MAPRHKRLHSGVRSGQPDVVQCSDGTAGAPAPRHSPAHDLTPTSRHVSDPAAEIAATRGSHASNAATAAAVEIHIPIYTHPTCRKEREMRRRNKYAAIAAHLFASVALLAVTGCSRPLSNTEKGALLGGAGGAGVGALLGKGKGAAIGGAAGAVGGAIIGNQMDQGGYDQYGDERYYEEQRRREYEQQRLEEERRRRERARDYDY
jgi:YmgG-like glycine-zipper protein